MAVAAGGGRVQAAVVSITGGGGAIAGAWSSVPFVALYWAKAVIGLPVSLMYSIYVPAMSFLFFPFF